jgi:hypothetical protein
MQRDSAVGYMRPCPRLAEGYQLLSVIPACEVRVSNQVFGLHAAEAVSRENEVEAAQLVSVGSTEIPQRLLGARLERSKKLMLNAAVRSDVTWVACVGFFNSVPENSSRCVWGWLLTGMTQIGLKVSCWLKTSTASCCAFSIRVGRGVFAAVQKSGIINQTTKKREPATARRMNRPAQRAIASIRSERPDHSNRSNNRISKKSRHSNETTGTIRSRSCGTKSRAGRLYRPYSTLCRMEEQERKCLFRHGDWSGR